MDCMPSPTQCRSVQDLWLTVGVKWEELGEEFLNELFKNYPEMQGIFHRIICIPDRKTAFREHGSKILRKIDISIGQLNTPGILIEDLQTLGARHPSYGVLPNKHKAPMKSTLFALVKRRSTGAFDEDAWDKVWELITEAMGLFDLYTQWFY